VDFQPNNRGEDYTGDVASSWDSAVAQFLQVPVRRAAPSV